MNAEVDAVEELTEDEQREAKKQAAGLDPNE